MSLKKGNYYMSEIELMSWLEMAQHDIDTVNLLLKEQGHPDIIIYHIHQAVEKLLKALVLKNDSQIEKTHHLDKILKTLLPAYPRLSTLEKDILEINYYLPKLRYPEGEKISQDEAIQCSLFLNNIKKVIDDILKTG